MQINSIPPPIRTKADAEYYYRQLVFHGWIPDIRNHPIEPHNPNNVLISTVTSSDGTFLEFNPQTGAISITGNPLEEGALDPLPDPNVTYNITLEGFIVANFVTDPEFEQTYEYLEINDLHLNRNYSESLLLSAGSYVGIQSIENTRHLIVTSTTNIYF